MKQTPPLVATTARKRFSTIFTSLLLVFLLMVIVITTALTTTFGARCLLFFATKLSPTPITFEKVSGNLMQGIHIKNTTINKLISAADTTLSLNSLTSLEIKATAKTVNLSPLVAPIADDIPQDIQQTLTYLSSIKSTQLSLHVPSQTIKIHVDYLNQSYDLLYEKARSNTVTLYSPKNKLSVSLSQQNDQSFSIHAHGSIYLPNSEQFIFDQWQMIFQHGSLNGTISGHSKSNQSQLHAKIQSLDTSHLHLQLSLKAPKTRIQAAGSLGQNSNLTLEIYNDQLTLGSLSSTQNHLQLSIKNHWARPAISTIFSAKQLSVDSTHAHSLYFNYSYDVAHPSKNLLGTISLRIKELISIDSFIFNQISLSNTQTKDAVIFDFSAQQHQSNIQGKFQIIPTQNHLQISIDHLQINQHSLISIKSPQQIQLSQTAIRLQKKPDPTSALSLNGSWDYQGHGYIELNINRLPTSQLPIEFIQLFIPHLESIDSMLTARLHLKRASTHQPLSATGRFTLDINHLYLNTLVDNIPLDSGLYVRGGSLNGTLGPELTVTGSLETSHGPIAVDIASTEYLKNFQGSFTGTNINLGHAGNNNILLDLDLSFTYANSLLNLDSQIKINRAQYRLAFFRPVTFLPSETVIVKPSGTYASNFHYKFNIDIDLGPKTEVHVIGFHGNLGGKLIIQGSDSTSLLANGTLNLNKGTLVIYKQALPIDRLSLTWFNTPINLPDTDMRVMAQGLRDIDGRDQMQKYGFRAHGPIDNLRFDYFSSPSVMNSFQIITALLTDSSFNKKSNTESLDQTLAYYHTDQRNSQLSEILDILNAIKSIPFFDNIDVSEINFDGDDVSIPEVNGVTITKRLDKTFSLRYRLSPNRQRNNRFSLDTNINNQLILTNFVQNEGDVGVALNYSGSK